MKGRSIILDHVNGLEAAAYLVDGKLDDLLIDQTDAPRPARSIARSATGRSRGKAA